MPQNYCLTFKPGQTSYALCIKVLDDCVVDPGKRYFLNIDVSSIPKGIAVVNSTAEITIMIHHRK